MIDKNINTELNQKNLDEEKIYKYHDQILDLLLLKCKMKQDKYFQTKNLSIEYWDLAWEFIVLYESHNVSLIENFIKIYIFNFFSKK